MTGSEQGEHEPETLRLRRLVALSPSDSELRLRLAVHLMERHRYEDAVAELRTLIRQNPNNLRARKLREEVLRHAFARSADL
jgi:thioredoxin-like negative regulator of GroEL